MSTPGFMVEVYVKSDLPLNEDRVMPVLKLSYITIGLEPQDKAMTEAFVFCHMKNVEIILSENIPMLIPDDPTEK